MTGTLRLVPLLTLVASLSIPAAATAQPADVLSARASRPQAMGWMQGFPPPADKTIRFTDADYFAFPKLRWTVCHFRELMPTVGVDNGTAAARALPQALDESLGSVRFVPLGSTTPMTWHDAFDANYSDGVIVLHHGRVVYERYDGCLTEHTLHGAMSVTKSITGLLGEILVAEGRLDDTALVAALVPELRDSAFGDATLRQVMDMTTALDYSEDYADPDAEVWTYAAAGSPLPKPAGYSGPRSYFEYLQTVRRKGRHGDAFGYKTVNADALGWIIARATGTSVAELLSQRIWRRIGAEREAYYTVDSTGTPFAGGGFNATLRDLARLGQLMLSNGQLDGEQVVPVDAIARIRHGGDPRSFAKAGYALLAGWRYAGMWWVSGDDHGSYAARGVHGQTIWIDPRADVVIVRFASHPLAANAASDPTSLPAYRAVAEHLIASDPTPLLGREWVIEDIAGAGVIDDSHATLSFFADGRLAGSTGCNRILGSYEAVGDRLKIAPAGTTRMACPPALMDQERKLLALLPKVAGYRVDRTTQTLVLTLADGATLTARR